MKTLYPPITPHKIEILPVSKLHQIYFEESGNPKGIPILRIHGGPGGCLQPDYRQLYNPKKYRIILYDQRGCGKSKPFGELKENTTRDLVNDIDKLRKHLGIAKWVISGGSWGSCLALAYAELHPTGVRALILNSIFLFTKKELEWQHNDSLKAIYPDVWEIYNNFIPKEERHDLFEAYKKRILGSNNEMSNKAIQMFGFYDTYRLSLIPGISKPSNIVVDDILKNYIRFHFYFTENKGFLKEKQLLNNISAIQNIPGIIVHGRYDMECPMDTAWELHKAWPRAKFEVAIAGHRTSEPAIVDKIIEFTDTFRLS